MHEATVGMIGNGRSPLTLMMLRWLDLLQKFFVRNDAKRKEGRVERQDIAL
jgi:hypothetical protein